MERFPNDREALDFVVSRISDEGLRDGTPLSEIERKMLYFSETAWTLPDILEVNEEFDKNYNQEAYERKISQLIRKAVRRARKQQPEEFEAWIQAIRRLRKEDRYLLLMVDHARVGLAFRPPRPPGDLLKLWGTGITLVAFFCGLVWLINKLFPGNNLSTSAYVAFWMASVCAAVLYFLLRLLIGGQKLDRVMVRATDWLFGRWSSGREDPPA